MRVNIESFEKWYVNQIKYHKVNGEEPGKKLKETGTDRGIRKEWQSAVSYYR